MQIFVRSLPALGDIYVKDMAGKSPWSSGRGKIIPTGMVAEESNWNLDKKQRNSIPTCEQQYRSSFTAKITEAEKKAEQTSKYANYRLRLIRVAGINWTMKITPNGRRREDTYRRHLDSFFLISFT